MQDKENDLDQISLNNTVNKEQEKVIGEFRVALDAKHVVSIAKHLNSSHFWPSNHLCFWREL